MDKLNKSTYFYHGIVFHNIDRFIEWYNDMARITDVDLDRALDQVIKSIYNANESYELSNHKTITKHPECYYFNVRYNQVGDEIETTVIF